MKVILHLLLVLAMTTHLDGHTAKTATDSSPRTVGPDKGWLVIQGGGAAASLR
jgi:hypothetical protein